MNSLLIIVLAAFIAISVVIWFIQKRKQQKIKRAIAKIIHWFDYIISRPNDFEIEQVRDLGDLVDFHMAETGVGREMMYFAPKLKEYIVERFGKRDDEDLNKAFSRLAQWESDSVMLDVYWTMIRGNFAEYIERRGRGEQPDFTDVSAPIAVIRKYWGV